MNIPKRFKLHEATGDDGEHLTGSIRAIGNKLIAVDSAGFAVVPIVGHSERPGADLPRLQPHEDAPDALVPAKAWATAAQGKTGEGRLLIGELTCEANSGAGKPTVVFEQGAGSFPSIQSVLDQVARPAPVTHHHIELCLDAEALVRISRAIGAQEAVRLRFLVNADTGRLDAAGEAHGAIEIRPVREPDAGSGVLMAVIIN